MNWPAPPVYNLASALERLPPHAQAKHAALAAELADAVALVQTALERVKRQEVRCGQIARRRDFAASNSRDAAATAERDAELQAAVELLGRHRAALDARNAVRAHADQTLGRLNNFVQALVSGMSDLVPPPPPGRLPPLQRADESIPQALERSRREIAVAQAEISRIKNAPLPLREVRDAISAEIDKMALAGQPKVQVLGTTVAVSWPDLPPAGVQVPGATVYAPGSASRLACWLFGDRIKAELVADLPADSPHAIASADRPGLLRELEGKIHALECVEEKLVMHAQAAGLDVQRRQSASPWAILFTNLEPEQEALQAAE